MPDHGRGRISAAALHAWDNQDVPYRPLLALFDRIGQMESVGVLKDAILVAEEKEIGGRQTMYSTRRDIDDQLMTSSRRGRTIICLEIQ